MIQLALSLPAPAPYVCTARALAEIDWLFGKGPHPDDGPVETPEESARIIAERHRASVRALWGGR